MGDVAVDNKANSIPPHKKTAPAHAPINEVLDAVNHDGANGYSTYKKLQRELEYINLQEEYIKDEQRYAHTSTLLQGLAELRRAFLGVSSVSWYEHRKKSNAYKVCRSSSASSWKPLIKSTRPRSRRASPRAVVDMLP